MSEYSIHVINGKVIGDSVFFLIATDLLHKEIKRICDFTDALEKAPRQKKEKIAEYKCAKYRYATVSVIHSTIYNNNRFRKLHNLEYSHYLLEFFDEMLKERTEYWEMYDSAPINEKPDFSLYYAMLAFADKEIEKIKAKSKSTTDWEKIELEERIGGLRFAKACLNEAWDRRKDVIE